MPHFFDFKKLDKTSRILVVPRGWVEPLYVEYGVGRYKDTLSYFWRVEGTQHTFTIPVTRMNFLSEGNYEKHFSEALEAFRADYLDWQIKDPEYSVEWHREYREQFGKFIVT